WDRSDPINDPKQRTSASTALSRREGQGRRDYSAHAAPPSHFYRRVGRRSSFGTAFGLRTLNQEGFIISQLACGRKPTRTSRHEYARVSRNDPSTCWPPGWRRRPLLSRGEPRTVRQGLSDHKRREPGYLGAHGVAAVDDFRAR